jgi:hypothetical protein
MESLVAELHAAWEARDRDTATRILERIRERLSTPDEDASRVVARAAHDRSIAGRKLRFLISTHPDPQRRRILRSYLAEAAPPAPAALPSLTDRPAVASLLTGPRETEEKLWVLRRLDTDVLASPEVLAALGDILERPEPDDELARTVLLMLSRVPRAEAERLAVRAIEASSDPSLRQTAVRLLGRVAGPEGNRLLLVLLRDDPDTVLRRHAALGLRGKPVDDWGMSVLGSVAVDPGEDRAVRMNVIAVLQAVASRSGPMATAASDTAAAADAMLAVASMPAGDTR